MGIIRFLLALIVVFSHSAFSFGGAWIGGPNAVQLFFLISGFLISFVLLEAKSYPDVKSFYFSRWLRLWPMYLVALILTAIFTRGAVDFIWSMPLEIAVPMALSNIFLFGQDLFMFLAFENGELVFTPDFRLNESPLHLGLVISPAWSLGVELMFYLVAPFIVKNVRLTLLFLAASLALRAWLIHIGLGLSDPWSYRFFPTEMAIFLVGALSHRYVYPFYRSLFHQNLGIPSCLATVGFIVFIYHSNVIFASFPPYVQTLALLIVFALVMPLTFIFTNCYRWDAKIGDLSYPIYIVHFLFILVTLPYSKEYPIATTAINVTGSIALAMVLNHLVGRPVEHVRAVLKSRLSKRSASTLKLS